MIKIILKNETLDIDQAAVLTFKKSQQLNGIQDLYSYSNNFNLLDTSKNRRLLGINYLPNSKAKSMTAGYDVDVVLNGCIFLKKQKLKVQKELTKNIPVYLIFSDNYFIAKAKELLMNQIDTGVVYTKTYLDFLEANNRPADAPARTAPISAQEDSGLIVVEEVPILLRIQDLLIAIFTQMGYAYSGDILTDENIKKYYTSSNVGVYGPDGTPAFDTTKTAYDFILDFLETFNGYIEVSDSAKAIGVYFWKYIDEIKERFVDYSHVYTGYKEYAFEGGLAKINAVNYSDSADYYNSFFDNNKSIVDKADYLISNFGAGPMRLFGDSTIEEDGTIALRVNGERTDPQTMNIYVFENFQTAVQIYRNGSFQYAMLYRAVSPNMLQIFQEFHKQYTDNIALPTVGQLAFKYNAIFLSEFKMFEVFFIKQLSTYWLPMELNFSNKKDGIQIKALMIQKTPVDVPIVFDLSMSVDFYGEAIINDLAVLYAAYNVSPAATMIITAADLTKNRIFVNDIEVLAFPTAVSVSDTFQFKAQNNEPDNVLSNSDILFQFVSEQGGISRVGKINVAHNGRANFMSEFRSEVGTLYTYGRDNVDSFIRYLNYSAKITTPINIADTYAPGIGDVATLAEAISSFKILQFERASTVKLDLLVEYLQVKCSNRGGGAEAKTTVQFVLFKNGAEFMVVHTAGAIDAKKKSDTTVVYTNIAKTISFNVLSTDVITMAVRIVGQEQDRIGSGQMDGSASMRNINWKFYVTEQL